MSPRVELESKTEKDAGPSTAKFDTATMALMDLLLSMTLHYGKKGNRVSGLRKGLKFWLRNNATIPNFETPNYTVLTWNTSILPIMHEETLQRAR